MADTETGLVTTDINVAILWRVVHKFNNRANEVRMKSFFATEAFHTKFAAIVAIIRWTMPLEKVFHLPQPCFSFVSVLPQDRRNPALRRINFATNWQLTKLKENQPFIIFFVIKFSMFWFLQNFVSAFKKAIRSVCLIVC